MQEHERSLAYLVAIGLALAIGKLLVSKEPVTWRIVVGRSIIGCGLTLAAGAALAVVPGLSTMGLLGIGSGLGILGTGALEKVLQKWTR